MTTVPKPSFNRQLDDKLTSEFNNSTLFLDMEVSQQILFMNITIIFHGIFTSGL